jgi:hypothetical protein
MGFVACLIVAPQWATMRQESSLTLHALTLPHSLGDRQAFRKLDHAVSAGQAGFFPRLTAFPRFLAAFLGAISRLAPGPRRPIRLNPQLILFSMPRRTHSVLPTVIQRPFVGRKHIIACAKGDFDLVASRPHRSRARSDCRLCDECRSRLPLPDCRERDRASAGYRACQSRQSFGSRYDRRQQPTDRSRGQRSDSRQCAGGPLATAPVGRAIEIG